MEALQAWWNGLTPGAQDQVIGGLIVAVVLGGLSLFWRVVGGAGKIVGEKVRRPATPAVPSPEPAPEPPRPTRPDPMPPAPSEATRAASPPSTLPESPVSTLARRLGSLLTNEELNLLAVDLGLDHEELSGAKMERALKLATLIRKRGLEAALEEVLRRHFPHAIGITADSVPPVGPLTIPDRRPVLGRAKEKAEIVRRIERGDDLIVLWGGGGLGKSALARHAYHTGERAFPDGHFWLDLRQEPAPLFRALLAEIGAPAPNESNVAALVGLARGALRGRRALLVLDNAETLTPGDPERFRTEVDAPRLPAPAVTLVTTRTHYRATDDIPITLLSMEDSLALLRERLGWEEGTATAERTDAEALIRHCDGHVLTLELTVERMRDSVPPQRCAAALADLRARGTPDRVTASFDLSYGPLAEGPRRLFHALGVAAPGGAPISGLAEMVGMEERAAEEALLALSRLALATVDLTARRARLHPLLHDFALKRATDHNDEYQRLVLRHAEHFGMTIGGGSQRAVDEDKYDVETLLLIDAEQENVRLAQERALTDGFPAPALAAQLTYGLGYYWQLRPDSSRLAWLRKAVPLATKNSQIQTLAHLMARIGDVHRFNEAEDEALESYQEALALYIRVEDINGQAYALQGIGDVQTVRREDDAALATSLFTSLTWPYLTRHYLIDKTLALYNRTGKRLGRANVLRRIADLQAFSEQFETALATYEVAYGIYSNADDRHGEAKVISHKGIIFLVEGKNEDADRLLN